MENPLSKLTKEEEKALCNIVLEAWDQYVKYGFLEALQKQDGYFKDEHEKQVFQAGWLTGMQHAMNLSMLGLELIKRN